MQGDAKHKIARVKKVIEHWREWEEQTAISVETIDREKYPESYISVRQSGVMLRLLTKELEDALKD